MNPIDEENASVRQELDFAKIFEFQKTHKIEVLLGRDFLYQCWIDESCYSQSLTPLHAFVFGVEKFKLKAEKILKESE